MPFRRYRYVGPEEIRLLAEADVRRMKIGGHADLLAWVSGGLPPGRNQGAVTATFVIDVAEDLWIADRRSEHVACAGGGEVLAAGEMVFERRGDGVEVSGVTNQSTGYCPEPDCWDVVARVLDRLGLERPDAPATDFIFRRCGACASINLVKDGVFECDVCGADLDPEWNFGAAD